MKDPALYLIDIQEAISKIEDYTSAGYAFFKKSDMVKDAVVRNLEIIGEVVKRLPATWQDRHKDIPWRQIAGMRDFLIHDYGVVDLDEVWQTVERDIPKLKKAVASLRRANK